MESMNKIVPLMKRKYPCEDGIQEIMTMETSWSICFSDHGTLVASCLNGSCKRKTMNSVSKIYTYSPHFDGHQWRKYGEKKIKNTKFSRGYYRCSYSKDQGCQATKHVEEQNSCNDPPFFLVTYYEYHSCKNTNPMIINTQVSLHNPLITDPIEPKLVSFEPNAKSKQEWSLLSTLNSQQVSLHERFNNLRILASSSSVLNDQLPVSVLDQTRSVSTATHDQYDRGNMQTKGNYSKSNHVPPSSNQATVKSVANCEYEDLSSILDYITPASPPISMDFFMMDYSRSDEGFTFHSF